MSNDQLDPATTHYLSCPVCWLGREIDFASDEYGRDWPADLRDALETKMSVAYWHTLDKHAVGDDVSPAERDVCAEAAQLVADYRRGRPHRVQRSRRKGSRLDLNTVCVTRGTKWGNPFTVAEHGRDEAIALYRAWLPTSGLDPTELAGRNLACWCKLDELCHADVLLDLANAWDNEP